MLVKKALFFLNLNNQNSIQDEIKSRMVRECLLSFKGKSFFFQFAIQKFKD